MTEIRNIPPRRFCKCGEPLTPVQELARHDAYSDDESKWKVISSPTPWVVRSVDEEDRQNRALISRLWGDSWDSPENRSYRLR